MWEVEIFGKYLFSYLGRFAGLGRWLMVGKFLEWEWIAGLMFRFQVNNAGSGYMMPLLDVDIEDAKKMFETNVWGLLAVTKVFAPLVIRRRVLL